MLKFLSDIRNMPYHIRKKVLDRFYSVLMYSFLFLVLFPVFWMIYNSFMGNTDIVQGKLFFKSYPNNVLFAEKEGGVTLMGTSDGAVTYYNSKTKKVTSRKTFKTHLTNYAVGEKYIWLASADKGIIRIEKDNLNKYSRFSINWDAKMDFNKISKTMIVVDEAKGKGWVTLGYQDFDKVFEFNTDTLAVTNTYLIALDFPMSFEKLAISSILNVGDKVYAATNKGIAEIDTVDQKVAKIYENPDFAAAEPRVMKYDAKNGNIYVASMSRVYVINPKAKTISQIYSTIKDDTVEQIGTLTLLSENVILGTGHGLIFIDRAGKFLSEVMAPLFDDIDEKGKLIIPQRKVNSDVYYAETSGDSLILGTSAGRVTVYNHKQKKLIGTVLVDKPGFLNIHWRNFVDLFNNINFGLYLRNSFLICGLTAFIAMLFATITAYALVRFDFPGKQFLSNAVLSTQMIPGVMTLIPVYIMFIKFTELTGIPIKGTMGGMIFVYSAFFLPFSIWILRGFFASIPIALEEAATIDGCTPLQIFYKIAIPLSIPGIVATGIYIFLCAWDELLFAWVLTNAETMTIPVGIRLFVGNFQNRYDLLMAASTVSTIPVMIMFALLQKHIISGLTSGAVKD